MKHLANLPIGSRHTAIDVSGYFYPCIFNYCDSMPQYLGIITTPY